MKIQANDKIILFFIKYAPIIFVILLSLFTTQIVINEKETQFNNEIIEIKKRYHETNKKRVKEEVERVFKYIKKRKENTENLVKKSIKDRVYEAHLISTNIYEKNKHKKSKEEIFSIIKTTLGSIIFNEGRGYYFLPNLEGIVLLQPLYPQFEGVDISDLEDAKGYKFAQAFKRAIREKTEFYDSYFWYRNKDEKTSEKKISFIKYFEPYNIAIGTGEYVKSVEEKLQKEILEYIQDIRYGNNAYIFVIDYEGKFLAHYKKEFIGMNRINYKNKDGKYLVKDAIDFARNNSGEYMSYKASINTDKNASSTEKVSYMISFDDYKWVIGTGFYTEALNKEIASKKAILERNKNKNIQKILFVSVTITLILLLISIIISKILEKRLENYKKRIAEHVLKNKVKDELMHQQAKMATMGEMIANIAHQWRQPLNQISTISTGIDIQREFGSLSDAKLEKDMAKLHESVEYLSETIDDFRNFFSPKKHVSFFILQKTIEKTINLLESQFNTHEIKIIRKYKNIRIQSLENELLQVLINILKNAQEALVKNNLNKEKLLFITLNKSEKEVHIQIKDNAEGIPKEIIDNIFDSYFTTKGSQGTGLGLYMSKNIIVNSMKGKLTVKNVTYEYKNKNYIGAEFSISIPLDKKE